jgi:formate hydrogenlyase subunit 6/NADH:ubiquinone oxidoreductase subunit I
MSSIVWYLHEFVNSEWVKKFIYVRTPYNLPQIRFRSAVKVDAEKCTYCGACMAVCPVPNCIRVSRATGENIPEIDVRKCIRCGMCVEVCAPGALSAGRIREDTEVLVMELRAKILVDSEKCMGCGSCVVACPSNEEIDESSVSGKGPVEPLVLNVINGKVVNPLPEFCRGCMTCVMVCPKDALELVVECIPAQLVTISEEEKAHSEVR